MITIRQGASINLKTKEALFIAFPYNLELVNIIKSLTIRYYIPNSKEWEVPIKDINIVLSIFSKYEVKIEGKIKKEVKEKIDKMVRFDDTLTMLNYKSKTTSFSHQNEGVAYGLAHNKFLLADEQGLGKTKQSIDLACIRKDQFKHCLIICCVNGLKWNWMEEINIHSNEKGHIIGSYYNKKHELKIGSGKERHADLCRDIKEYFLITNVETLQNAEVLAKLNEMCAAGTIGMVIIDEIHKGAVNPSTIQGKSIHKLQSYYKVALTGTPILNSPLDSYNILKWLDIEKHAYYSFKNRYCVTGGYGGYEILGYKNLSELESIINKCMLRRKKDEVLDLPPKIYSNEYVEMSTIQRNLYNDVKQSIMENIDQVKTATNPLSQLIRLRQATASTSILSSKFNESVKIDRLKELLNENRANNQKTIVFTNWTKVTDILQTELTNYKPLFITGETPDSVRQENVNKFQNENYNVIVGTIGAMGTGLTLNKASNVIFLDLPWNYGTLEQASDRAHRIGTTQSVSVKLIICKDSIDERIHELVLEKMALSDALIDGKWNGLNKSETVDFLLN